MMTFNEWNRLNHDKNVKLLQLYRNADYVIDIVAEKAWNAAVLEMSKQDKNSSPSENEG